MGPRTSRPAPGSIALLAAVCLAMTPACTARADRGLPDAFGRVECLLRADPGAADELADVSGARDWAPCAPRVLSAGFSRSAHWFRLAAPVVDRPALLVLEWKVISEVDLFVQHPDGRIERFQAGIRRARSAWPLPISDYPAFQIEPQSGAVWYLRIHSAGRLNFPITVHTREEFERRAELHSAAAFSYAGILSMVALGALVFAVGLRESVYAYYAGYVFFLWLNRNANYGNAFSWMYPESPWIAEHINLFALGMTYLFTLLFFRKFTRLREFMPRADRIAVILQYVAIALIPITLTNAPRFILAWTYITLYLLSIAAFLAITFRLLFKHNQRSLHLFAAGWTIFYLAAVPHILYLLNVLPYSIPTVFGPALILPLEALLFLGGLFQRYRSILSEKEDLARQHAEILSRMESFRDGGARYTKSRLSKIDADAVLVQLNHLMDNEKLFRDEALTLATLAQRVSMKPYELSELLNSRLGLSFPQLVLNYRVEEAERLMNAHPEKNLLTIAFEAGFNSKTAFNVGFKKLRGVAPSQYRSTEAKHGTD